MQAVPHASRPAGHAAAPGKSGTKQTDPVAFNAVMTVAVKSVAAPAKTRHRSASATSTPAATQPGVTQLPAFALFHLPQTVPDQKSAAQAASAGPAPAAMAATSGTAAPPTHPITHGPAAAKTIAAAEPAPPKTDDAAPSAPAPVEAEVTAPTGPSGANGDKAAASASAPAAPAISAVPETRAPAAKLISEKAAASDKPATVVSNTLSPPAVPPAPALAAVTAPSAPSQPSPPVATSPAVATVADSEGIAATPAALAASITAMHRNGQTSATLRLDPPGLGTLSIHLALGHAETGGAGHVNLLMVPAVTQTAQLLNSGIDSLRQALAAAGLTLGQAQIGQGSQDGGQGGQNGAPDPQRSGNGPAVTTATPVTEVATNSPGVRAYA